jgi:hypothetical protein
MARLGIVLYWAATAIAVALVVLAVFAYFTATGTGALQGALFIVAFAGGLADRPRDIVPARWPLTPRYGFRNSSGSLATFTAIPPRLVFGERRKVIQAGVRAVS